jgi:hypothetical protein
LGWLPAGVLVALALSSLMLVVRAPMPVRAGAVFVVLAGALVFAFKDLTYFFREGETDVQRHLVMASMVAVIGLSCLCHVFVARAFPAWHFLLVAGLLCIPGALFVGQGLTSESMARSLGVPALAVGIGFLVAVASGRTRLTDDAAILHAFLVGFMPVYAYFKKYDLPPLSPLLLLLFAPALGVAMALPYASRGRMRFAGVALLVGAIGTAAIAYFMVVEEDAAAGGDDAYFGLVPGENTACKRIPIG